jgi:hypothetical protein
MIGCHAKGGAIIIIIIIVNWTELLFTSMRHSNK